MGGCKKQTQKDTVYAVSFVYNFLCISAGSRL